MPLKHSADDSRVSGEDYVEVGWGGFFFKYQFFIWACIGLLFSSLTILKLQSSQW